MTRCLEIEKLRSQAARELVSYSDKAVEKSAKQFSHKSAQCLRTREQRWPARPAIAAEIFSCARKFFQESCCNFFGGAYNYANQHGSNHSCLIGDKGVFSCLSSAPPWGMWMVELEQIAASHR
jgi:hypothetical protein